MSRNMAETLKFVGLRGNLQCTSEGLLRSASSVNPDRIHMFHSLFSLNASPDPARLIHRVCFITVQRATDNTHAHLTERQHSRLKQLPSTVISLSKALRRNFR